jgi:asparagine synthase (glutamine-hydrolysing)
MDSSILLHHMCKHAAPPVRTFTVRFEVKRDEGEAKFNTDADLAALTAKHYGTSHTEVLLTAAHCRDIYRETARALDQPNADTVAPAQFFLAREAKKQVDVVLTGAGGDELFGGYPRYRLARILQATRALPGSLRTFAGSRFGVPSDVASLSPGPLLAERLLARAPSEVSPLVRGNWFDPDATTRLFAERYEDLQGTEPVRALMECDRALWLVDESLRLTDGTTMGSGLEARVPFLDPRMIAAALSTPASWHVGWRTTKALLKETYLPLLPPHLQSLKKAGFFPPFAKWLRRECAPLVEETLENPRIRELFDIEAIRRMRDAHANKDRYAMQALSTVIQLSFWFEEVYDASTPSA